MIVEMDKMSLIVMRKCHQPGNHSFGKIESVPEHYLSDFFLGHELYVINYIRLQYSSKREYFKSASLKYRLHFFLAQATIVHTFDKYNIRSV